jgi:hypothetical protein
VGLKQAVSSLVSKVLSKLPVVKTYLVAIGSRIPLPKIAVFKQTFLKVFSLFRGGLWMWVGLAVYVVAENWAGLTASVHGVSPAPLFVSVAENLGTSYLDVVDGLRTLPSQKGWGYLSSVNMVVGGAAHIGWYFKAWHKASRLVEGYNISKLYIYGFSAIPIYMVLVWAETGVVPVFSHVAELSNVSELLEFERLNPWHDSSVNESLNQTANETANATVNGTGG